MRVIQSKWLTGVLMFLVIWLGVGVWRVRQVQNDSERDVAHARSKLEQLKLDNARLEQLLVYLKNPEFLARQVRAKLNYQYPDEQVAYVYPAESKPASASADAGGSGVLETIKRWLGKLF